MMVVHNRFLIVSILLVTCVCVNSVTISEHVGTDEQVCRIGDRELCGDKTEESCSSSNKEAAYNMRVYTIASKRADGFQRFNRSARIYGIKFETLDLENDFDGDDSIYSEGGYKLNLLKRAIKKLEDNADTLILYTDSYNVIYTQTLEEIGNKFRKTGARILVGAQHISWPDASLEDLYPRIESGSRFVNGDMFIGYVSEIKQLLNSAPIRNTDKSQMFIAKAYLNEKLRSKLNMKLDHRSDIFQSLHESTSHVSLEIENGEYHLHNNATGTRPSIVQGNGPSDILLNNFGNYLAKARTHDECEVCREYVIVLESDSKLPRVALAVFIQKATPFFNQFLEMLGKLDYPNDKLDLFIYNAYDGYDKNITTFIKSKSYKSVKQSLAEDKLDEAMARNLAVSHAMELKSDYIFVVDAEARLADAQTLRELLKQNRTFIAPMLERVSEYHGNFWGALSKNGYFARSHDYFKIANETIRGIWNVPYISTCYLAKKTILPIMSYYAADMDPDMVMCKSLRETGIFMYVSNQRTFGHLINDDDYNLLRTIPDFYSMDSNRPDWERQYIHPEYAGQLLPNVTHNQPCPDVFWFPIVTERFCADFIEILETFGKWTEAYGPSDEEKKKDYDPVPTQDIDMRKVGLHEQWLKFLEYYVQPLQLAVYEGYSNDPPNARNNFAVRYKPTEQAFLRPHHDSSTYTINIALNRPGIDYEGGGCRFVRYNCSVEDTKVGHMLMHPGRLTHLHEGLHVTNGTRYIMVSFVDPE